MERLRSCFLKMRTTVPPRVSQEVLRVEFVSAAMKPAIVENPVVEEAIVVVTEELEVSSDKLIL